jgi:hypothetical protein
VETLVFWLGFEQTWYCKTDEGNQVHFHCVLLEFRLIVGQTTCFGFSQAPGTSVSRGVRRNALVKASERHEKERPVLLGVKFAQITDRASLNRPGLLLLRV